MDIISRAESKAARHREVDATESERFQLYSQAEANSQKQHSSWHSGLMISSSSKLNNLQSLV